MRYFCLLIVLLAMSGACSSRQSAQGRVNRQPLEKSPHEYKSPINYDLRDRGYDPKTGERITYDHKPRIELIDAKTGKYAFKWIGYDGKEKLIIYQRADAIDVIVSADVSQTPDGKYLYSYKIENLQSSGTFLSRFMVQNFAEDTRPIEVGGRVANTKDIALLNAFRNTPASDVEHSVVDFHIGQMFNAIEQFKEGNWVSFGTLMESNPQILPGGTLEIKLTSAAPPDLVGCRVSGGKLTLKGVGEHIPFVLESSMRSYAEFPVGFTIGPVERILTLSPQQRAERFLDNLPQYKKMGWITTEAADRYERQLRRNSFGKMSSLAEKDFREKQITSEVLALARTINL